MSHQIWYTKPGNEPLVATAIHDGHEVRESLLPYLAVSDETRLREEDPYTGLLTSVAKTRLIVKRSRFEVDLNRPKDSAVYRTSDDAWDYEPSAI